ncbi:MAG: hypothetical protein ACE5EA_07220 [Nitrospirota bacterium]
MIKIARKIDVNNISFALITFIFLINITTICYGMESFGIGEIEGETGHCIHYYCKMGADEKINCTLSNYLQEKEGSNIPESHLLLSNNIIKSDSGIIVNSDEDNPLLVSFLNIHKIPSVEIYLSNNSLRN